MKSAGHNPLYERTKTVQYPIGERDQSQLTVSEAGDLWIRRARTEELEESTVRQYRQHLDLHIHPLIGQQPINSLTSPMLESFKDTLLRTRSRAMSRKVLTSLKSILSEAVRLGHVPHNVAMPIQIRRKPRAPISGWNLDSSTCKIPTKAEIRDLISGATHLFPICAIPIPLDELGSKNRTCWQPFFMAAVLTGMRSSELRGLIWKHVNLHRKIIEVRQRADFRNRLGPPKSAAGYREIPMAPIVFRTLSEWRAVCPATDSDLVFPSRNGRVHTNSNIHKQCWGPLQLHVGLTSQCHERTRAVRPRFPFHVLRHAAASLFIDQGWPPKKVQIVMGHSSIQVTFDTYGKLWNDHEVDLMAMASLEKRLLG